MTDKLTSTKLIELHDAKVDSFAMGGQSELKILFSHMSFFVQRGVEEFDVWSCRAVLTVSGLQQLEIHGAFDSTDYVSGGSITDVNGSEVELVDLLRGLNVRAISLQMGSGTRIDILAHVCRLEVQAWLESFETWKGPLRA